MLNFTLTNNHLVSRRFTLKCLLLIVVASFCSLSSAQESEEDWPCVQVLVPEVVTAVFWPEIIEQDMVNQWLNHDDIRALAQKLGDIDELTNVEREEIQAFAESIDETERLQKLNLLADGIVSTANDRRARFIDGIKRYTRQQIAISKQLQGTLNELAEVENQDDESAAEKIAEIEETLRWHERVYDQREAAIQALCDRPVELEEVLSGVLRELAGYLP